MLSKSLPFPGLSLLRQVWGHTRPCGLSLSARKTSKQVFVSYNLPNTSSSFELLVENRIREEMQAFPEKF